MAAYDKYFLMKEEDVAGYVQAKYAGHFAPDAKLTVKEIGDGNLNYVFICTACCHDSTCAAFVP